MNYWNHPGVPHKGWELYDVIDLRENGEEEWETDYETCMMCGKTGIRFIHIVSHPEIEEDYRVGCDCAEKMTEDYFNPKEKEKRLRNKASRRANWQNKNWRVSKHGNHYLNVNEVNITIYKDKTSDKYKVKIGEIFGKQKFDTLRKAKVAAFNGLEYLKDNDLIGSDQD